MKQEYEWVDVTGECKVEKGGIGAGLYVQIVHDKKQIGLLWNKDVPFGDYYRLRWVVSNGFVIEKRVPAKKPFQWKYTYDFVDMLDCENMSAESVLHHCVAKWDEIIAAHEAGVDARTIQGYTGGTTCPACIKWSYPNGCLACPLQPRCCDGLWQAYRSNSSADKARAVRDFIKGKLDEMQKPKWAPKVGDQVSVVWSRLEVDDAVVVAIRKNDFCPYVVYSPTIAIKHRGHSGQDACIIEGAIVPGVNHGHLWVDIKHLAPGHNNIKDVGKYV